MVSNIGKAANPDPWHDFGSSGTKANGGIWSNPIAIDMSQYRGLLLKLTAGGDYDIETGIELSLLIEPPAAAVSTQEGTEIMFPYASNTVREWQDIELVGEVKDGKAKIFAFSSQGGNYGPSLLGVDTLYIKIGNASGADRIFDSIEYRRKDFTAAG